MRSLLVLLVFMFSLSQAQAADEWWIYEGGSEGISAGTSNQAGQTLGQYCDYSESTCYWNLLVETSCDKGVTAAPALMADGNLSAAITAHCQGRVSGSSPATYRYLLSDFDSVDKLIRSGAIVGIAFALDSGRFQVMRFNTAGAVGKLDAMRAKANSRAKSTTGSMKL